MFSHIFKQEDPVLVATPLPGFSFVFKDAEASRKAWLSRARGIQHAGKEKGWVSVDGKPLTAIEKANIKEAKVPPGWKDIYVQSVKGQALIATGRDAKGKLQPRYSVAHTEKQALAKFSRVADLTTKMPKLITKSQKDMLNEKLSPADRDRAATVYLVTRTAFRPGSDKDTGTEHKAIGASTLQKKHIKVDGEKVSFDFTGKSGVHIQKTIRDKAMATYLGQKIKGLKDGDQVFSATGESAMKYMRDITGPNFKLKDLRTWNATALAANLISKEPVPTSAKALADQQRRIAKAVSSHLGNTPTVALKSYINPMVWKHTEGMTAVKEA